MTKLFPAYMLGSTLAAAAVLAVAAPAGAQSVQVPFSVAVRYGDLDLAHADGARALLLRIKTAATHACGGEPENRDLSDRQAFRACRKSAIDRAVATMSSPILTAMSDLADQPVRVAVK